MQTVDLSEAAMLLLRTCLEARRVVVTAENRETYRELARGDYVSGVGVRTRLPFSSPPFIIICPKRK